MFRGTAHIANNVAQVDEKDLISTIFNHIIKNHQREFKLEEAAELANMNPSAICRYIKKPPPKRFQKC